MPDRITLLSLMWMTIVGATLTIVVTLQSPASRANDHQQMTSIEQRMPNYR